MSAEAIPRQELDMTTLEDNARKFVVGEISRKFLDKQAATAFTLTVDWLKTDADSEKKIAHKEFENGDIKILLITKITKDGSRTSVKEEINDEEYRVLLASSILHLKKVRYEFDYTQADIRFSLKYDEYDSSELRILEVDASSDAERAAFDANNFLLELTEVTGDLSYYGYRVIDIA